MQNKIEEREPIYWYPTNTIIDNVVINSYNNTKNTKIITQQPRKPRQPRRNNTKKNAVIKSKSRLIKKIPSKKYKIIKKSIITGFNRGDIWEATYGTKKYTVNCVICKKNKITPSTFVKGHIIAKAKGGTNDLYNLRAICAECNSSMGTMNMNEYSKKKRTQFRLLKKMQKKQK